MSKISSIKVKQQDGYSEIPLAVTANNVEWDSSHSLVDIVNGKQNSLTFDSAPTPNSLNPVTSGGIYNAIQAGGGGGDNVYICTKDTEEADVISAIAAGKLVVFKHTIAYTSGGVRQTRDEYYILSYADIPASEFIFSSFDGSFKCAALVDGDWETEKLSLDDEELSSRTNRIPLSSVVAAALTEKQDALTFDSTPTSGSTNPVTSGGVYAAIQAGGGSDASLSSDVTSNLTVGAIAGGTTIEEGTSFTEFVQKLLIAEIAPTVTFSASDSGIKEIGTSVTPTLTLTISNAGTGTPTAIKFYNESTLLDTQSYVEGTNTYTFTMDAVTSTTTVKGVLEYTKSNDTPAIVEKSAAYTFVMASYYGAVATAPTDKAEIIALTKSVKNTKELTTTFTLSNQRSCYCYPASFGNLTSIKDANNFEYLESYTKTTVAVDGVDYNVYTLTDPVTATGFKQVYA